jgi:hypothetical protein
MWALRYWSSEKCQKAALSLLVMMEQAAFVCGKLGSFPLDIIIFILLLCGLDTAVRPFLHESSSVSSPRDTQKQVSK